ncbi:MAG: hypothetical protein JSW39_14720 [Desulfobacterales bacterium]|nr:MAG: hypothetical protein JSW39_14720 [Desulfobacterales bacterium]
MLTLIFGWLKDNLGSLSMGFGVLALLCLTALWLGRPVLKRSTAPQEGGRQVAARPDSRRVPGSSGFPRIDETVRSW